MTFKSESCTKDFCTTCLTSKPPKKGDDHPNLDGKCDCICHKEDKNG